MDEENVILESRFIVETISQDKKFQKVSRISAKSEEKIELGMDINTEIYPMFKDQSYLIVLTVSMGNQQADRGIYVPEETDNPHYKQLYDKYEYIMHGKLFKKEIVKEKDEKKSNLLIYGSFGGLLMRIKGTEEQLKKIENKVNSRVFLLIVKT